MSKLLDLVGTLASGFSIGRKDACVASAALQVDSTTQGILLPRLTTVQMNSITSPADWLEVVNTDLSMKFIYDGGRSKWLSEAELVCQAGRNGGTSAGTFYRGVNGMAFDTSTRGIPVPKGTLVGLMWTKSDTNTATLEVLNGSTSIATLASSASGTVSDWTLNADFSEGILSFRNQAGGNTTSNVQISAFYRRRA